jgi:hypothetical protein
MRLNLALLTYIRQLSKKKSQNLKRKHICIIRVLLRVEVSLFVPSPEIEGRNAVEAYNWARHKKTFYSE